MVDMFKYHLVFYITMNNGVRSNVTKENYDAVMKIATYPNNRTFDDSLKELLQKFKELKKQ